VFFNGKRIARVDLPSGTVHYYFSDHLGSHSVVANSTGSVIEQESDYYPYGGERVITAGANNYKFTGKERDSESNLDYFGARYYGSAMGRWISPDWADKAVAVPYSDLVDPQTLNLYGFVRNNPLSHIDQDGHADRDIRKILKGSAELVGRFGGAVAGAALSESGAGIPIALGSAVIMAKGAKDLGQGLDTKVDMKDADAGLKVVGGNNGLPDPVGVVETAVTSDIQQGAKIADDVNTITLVQISSCRLRAGG